MALLPGVVGGSDLLRSSRASTARSINWYPESIRGDGTKVSKWLRPTPGMEPEYTVDEPAGAVVRGEFQQDGRAWAVIGTSFYELFSGGTSTNYGTVADDGGMASICSNGSAGSQLLIIAGLQGYVFDLTLNTLTLIADADFIANPIQCDFMDGYAIVSQQGTRTFQISALEDFTSWDALDVAERSEGSDNIVSLIRSHREIWIIGSKTSEVWYDNGDALFPFAPVQGVFIEHGSAATFSVVRINETVMWLEQGELGIGTVVRADGFNPTQISTYTISLQIQGDFFLDQCRAWSYQEDGHSFYILVLPQALAPYNTSKCLDLTEGEWHERATWNATTCKWEQHRGQCHCFVFNKHLVGDRLTPTIYHLSSSFFDETLTIPA